MISWIFSFSDKIISVASAHDVTGRKTNYNRTAGLSHRPVVYERCFHEILLLPEPLSAAANGLTRGFDGVDEYDDNDDCKYPAELHGEEPIE